MMLSSPIALAAAVAVNDDVVVVIRIEWIRPERNGGCGMSSAAISITLSD